MEYKNESRFWLDHVIAKVLAAYPKGEIIISSGISPSGPYHVGHAREILTADALLRGLEEAGRKVRHLHFVDDFDVLRKRYPYLGEEFEQQVGKPLYSIPAPDGKSQSYADQFFNDYLKGAGLLGVKMEVMRANELYASGAYADMIALALKKRDRIARILKDVSAREVDDSWQPIQILDQSSGMLNTAKFLEFDYDQLTASYIGEDGNQYQADAKLGQIKLDWRLDWPARWKMYGVQVEGFGREHATKGGSFDTGKVLIKEIFGGLSPIPVPYDIISLKGESKKMSSSLGNLVTLLNSLEIIPPEILRYFTFKSRPEKQLNFDPEMGLYVLMDEYSRTEAETLTGGEPEFKRAWQIANLSGEQHVISTVPFSHMVTLYQTTSGDLDMIFELLKRTGHAKPAKDQRPAIERELSYIQKWLENYAPEKVKFSILAQPSQTHYSDAERQFLETLADKLKASSMGPDEIHNEVYETAVASGIKPAEAFKLLYGLFIGKDYGPKIGFFLSCLDKEFVLARLARKK